MTFDLSAQQFKIKYEKENIPNGDVWALVISIFLALAASGYWAFYIYTANNQGQFTD